MEKIINFMQGIGLTRKLLLGFGFLLLIILDLRLHANERGLAAALVQRLARIGEHAQPGAADEVQIRQVEDQNRQLSSSSTGASCFSSSGAVAVSRLPVSSTVTVPLMGGVEALLDLDVEWHEGRQVVGGRV